jgi:hypothetical protein
MCLNPPAVVQTFFASSTNQSTPMPKTVYSGILLVLFIVPLNDFIEDSILGLVNIFAHVMSLMNNCYQRTLLDEAGTSVSPSSCSVAIAMD